MPRILTKVRVYNPSRLKARPKARTKTKRLTLAQKLHFGTKRQRAAAKLSLSTRHKKRVVNGRSRAKGFGDSVKKAVFGNRKVRKARSTQQATYKWRESQKRAASRIGNPGEIITLAGLAGNPGRLKKRKVGNIMAKRRRKSVSRRAVGTRRRRRVARAHNPKVVVRYRNRRRTRRANTGRVRSVRRRHVRRHRNPGFLSGGVGMLVGIFGGAALTGAIAARIPGQLSSGIAGYLTTGVIAYAQGTLAGKLLKNPTLGKNMVTGGLIYLGLKVAGDLIPGLSLPFGLSGLGAIGTSNFTYPQIPANNTMIYPAAQLPVSGGRGMGRAMRMGRG